ncbi:MULTISPECIES: hypothetical protein [Chitinophagaceae]|nr:MULTISPECIES: hypothetical protein [Chitinophagaceae]
MSLNLQSEPSKKRLIYQLRLLVTAIGIFTVFALLYLIGQL